MIAAVILALAVASQGLVAVQSAHVDSVDAEAVCSGEASISSISQLHSVATQLKQGAKCSEDTKDAVIALDNAVSKGSQDACSTDNANMLQEFFFDHLDGSDLPESVLTFAGTYLWQTAQTCKVNMVNVFTKQMDDVIEKDANIDIGDLVEGGHSVDKLIRGSLGDDEVVLPSDLAFFFEIAAEEIESIEVSPAHANELNKVRELCANRLRPIYEPVLKPIVLLAQTGFDYPASRTLEEVTVDQKQREKLDSINRIVYLCETTGILPDNGVDSGKYTKLVVKPSAKIAINEIKESDVEDWFSMREIRKSELNRLAGILIEAVAVLEKYEKDRMEPEDAQSLEQMLQCTRNSVKVEAEDGLEVASDNNVPKACGGKVGRVNLTWVAIAAAVALVAASAGGS